METKRSQAINIILGMLKSGNTPSTKFVSDSLGIKRGTAKSYLLQAKEQYEQYIDGQVKAYSDQIMQAKNEYWEGFMEATLIAIVLVCVIKIITFLN